MTASGKILVVDDEENNREIFCRRLNKRGYSTVSVPSGKAALQPLKEQPFDLILLDVNMPEMDGVEVLKKARETHSQFKLPIIMCTARSQSEDIVQALEAGANDYLTKPIDFPVAFARIHMQIALKKATEELEKQNQQFQFEMAMGKTGSE